MKYTKGLVSLCVAQYNRSERVRESIGSLLAQTYSDIEVIVVNDGSPDEKVQAELKKLNHPNLKVIEQNNTGFVGAISRAIAESSGEFVYIHGAGDVAKPQLVERQVALLRTNADVGAVGCYYENCSFETDGAVHINTYAPKKTVFTTKDFETIYNPLGHGGTMYRRELYDRVAGYRSFFKFAQDHDLWIRMAEKSTLMILPEVLYQRGHFKQDGVVTNVDKIILQKTLQEFAIQSHFSRLNDGKDILDSFGIQAGLFRKKTKQLCNFFCWKALSMLYQKNHEKASVLATFAINEKKTMKAITIFCLCKLSKNARVMQVLNTLMNMHPQAKKWQ